VKINYDINVDYILIYSSIKGKLVREGRSPKARGVRVESQPGKASVGLL